MAEVRLLSGRKVNWAHPPKANAKCKLTLNGHAYTAGFRTLCHLNMTNNKAKKKFGHGVVVLQPPFNKSVGASAGTHDFDSVWDIYIPGVGWWDQQRFFRSLGWGIWYRHPPLFGNHEHGFTLPPRRSFARLGIKVGKYIDGGISIGGHKVTSSQLDDFYNHAFGLSGQHGHGSDKSWFPKDIDATIFNLKAYVQNRARKQSA